MEHPTVAGRATGHDGIGHRQLRCRRLFVGLGWVKLDTVSFLILAGALFIAGPGAGERLELQWEAPPECPPRAMVRERIGELVGAELVGQTVGDLRVVASARVGNDGIWTAELELWSRGEVRHRTIPRGRDCAEVAEAVAVVVAIAIDPGVLARVESEAEDSDDPEASTVPEPVEIDARVESETAIETESDAQMQPEEEPPSMLEIVPREPGPPRSPLRERLRAMVAVMGGVGYGALPGATGSLGGDVGLLLPRVRVTASASWWFRTRLAVQDATVEFGQWSAALRGCPVFDVAPRLELLACVGVEAGQTLVRTDGLREDRRRADPWVAGLVAPMLAVVPTRWLAIRAGPELVVPVTRSVYEVRGYGAVFQPTPAGVRGLIAVETRFP
jgi:hypothetical protein